ETGSAVGDRLPRAARGPIGDRGCPVHACLTDDQPPPLLEGRQGQYPGAVVDLLLAQLGDVSFEDHRIPGPAVGSVAAQLRLPPTVPDDVQAYVRQVVTQLHQGVD